MRDSDIIIPVICIGDGGDHMKSLELTAATLLDLIAHVEKLAPGAVIITPSNPVDIYNYLFYRKSALPASRWLGYSYNDSVRFRRMLGRVLNLQPCRISASMLGEHGPTKVPVFSSVEIDGKPFVPDPEQKTAVLREMDQWWDTYTKRTSTQRSAGWLSAYGVAEMVKRIRGFDDTPMPCSCILDGQYGQHGISMGVPVRLDRQGAAEIIEITLNEEEKAALETSAAKIRELTEYVLTKYT